MALKIFRRYRSRTPKVRNSKFPRASVEVGSATASAPLGPLLGQLQIPLLEFCNVFNDQSDENYIESFDLSLRLRKINSKYKYSIGFPFISFFVHQFYFNYGLELEDFIYSYYTVKILDIWYVLQLYCSLLNISVYQMVQMLSGSFYTSIIQYIHTVS